MRTTAVVATLGVLGLLAGAAGNAPDDGEGDHEPTVHEIAYSWNGSAEVQTNAAYVFVSAPCPSSGCVSVEVGEHHRFVELEVIDDSGRPVLASSRTQGLPSICGSTDLPLRLGQGLEAVWFEVAVGTCEEGVPSLPTSGVVRLTLHTTEPSA